MIVDHHNLYYIRPPESKHHEDENLIES